MRADPRTWNPPAYHLCPGCGTKQPFRGLCDGCWEIINDETEKP